jgi:hypothetical protein
MEIDTETALTRSKRKEGGELHSIVIFTFRFVIVAEISLQLIAQTCTYCEMRCRGNRPTLYHCLLMVMYCMSGLIIIIMVQT